MTDIRRVSASAFSSLMNSMLTLVTVVLAALVGGSLQQPGILPDAFVPLHLGESGNGGVAQTDYVKPAFCHDLDCPKYTVMETNDKFEKRHYAPSVWVATTMNTTNYTRALNSQMFFKLFRYISGNNSAHQKLAMTAPVLTEHVFETSVAMQFMIPFAQQAAPPTPTEPKVYIRNVPETTFYVRSYGGFDSEDIKRQNVEQLKADLNTMGLKYTDNVFLTAGYDAPYAFVRHNEVWLVAE
ncbi:heme-binding protein 2-like [Mya arenaria]|uniref:heme-binding protein 2-like n=1 Tax=Mya arenaria TaxID=6604 RepID=UPI0022E00B30|nr:heme-binding protein 2-like [Mya arenaria]